MIEIDLSHPVWDTPAGFILLKDDKTGRYCALGKLCVASGKEPYKEASYGYLDSEIFGKTDTTSKVYVLNDRTTAKGNNSIANHKKAIKLALKLAAKNPNVKFINGDINEWIK